MYRNESCVYRVGTVGLIIFSIVFLAGSFNEGLAGQPESWKPSKPMKIILSGRGAYDLIARQLVRVLPDYLGQNSLSRSWKALKGSMPWTCSMDRLRWSYNKSARCGHVRRFDDQKFISVER
jgi:hypothetical protein